LGYRPMRHCDGMAGGATVTKVYAYLRVSGKSQLHGDGFTRQFIAIRKYCEQNDLKIVRVFKERGVSGTKELDDRPALSALFSALEEDGVKGVIVEKLDRMARDLMIQETIIQDMQKKDYILISVYEPDLCSEEPSRILIRQIFGALAQWERAMIVLKLKGARDRIRARTGKCDGRKSWGEKPGEQEVLSRMKSMRAAGAHYYVIADTLNAEGVPCRMAHKGKVWKANTIQKILTRKTKVGTA